METNLKFTRWRCRSSSLGKIMTNLEGITQKGLDRIKELESERDTGLNINSNKVKFIGTKKPDELAALIAKRDTPDQLPTGAKSYLDEVFNDVFWGRKELLDNKYLDKGLRCEQDILNLLSVIEGEFYTQNTERVDDEWTTGIYDTELREEITDTKANYSLATFDKADLSTLYEWQIKDYLRKKGYKSGWLCYGLVNSPLHHITNERTRLLYAMGNPDSEDPKWKEAVAQIERNHIFDIAKFQSDYPYYVFENEKLDFDIPAVLRIKKFPVILEPEDAVNIKSRVVLAREYLVKKELAIYEKMKTLKSA